MDNNLEIQTLAKNFYLSLVVGSKQNINMGQPLEKRLHKTLNLPRVPTIGRNLGATP